MFSVLLPCPSVLPCCPALCTLRLRGGRFLIGARVPKVKILRWNGPWPILEPPAGTMFAADEAEPRSEIPWPGSLAAENVVGVHQLAQIQGQAPAADAAAQVVAQSLEPGDLIVEVVAPGLR